jgi:chromosome segregation ATPase
MYLKEVILDGFKSYGQRTVVSGFDPHFNAITGALRRRTASTRSLAHC